MSEYVPAINIRCILNKIAPMSNDIFMYFLNIDSIEIKEGFVILKKKPIEDEDIKMYVSISEVDRKTYIYDDYIYEYETKDFIKNILLFLGSIQTSIYEKMIVMNEDDFCKYIYDNKVGALIKPSILYVNGIKI